MLTEREVSSPGARPGAAAAFREVYDTQLPFVWRTVARLGVASEARDDVVQEVFLVVHRKLEEFGGRSSMRTWIYGVVRRVVADHRRSRKRKPLHEAETELEALRDTTSLPPDDAFAEEEAFRLLNRVLDELEDDKREAFVLAEFEGLTMAEIAEMLDVNANTVSSRLRAARREFDEILARHATRDEWRSQ